MAWLSDYYKGAAGAEELDLRDRNQLIMQGEPLRYSRDAYISDRDIADIRKMGGTMLIPREGGGYSIVRPDPGILPGGDRQISGYEAGVRSLASQAGGRPLDDPFGIAANAAREMQNRAYGAALHQADFLSQFLPENRIVEEVKRLTGVDLTGRLASTPNLMKRRGDEAEISSKRAAADKTRLETAAKREEIRVDPIEARSKVDALLDSMDRIRAGAEALMTHPGVGLGTGITSYGNVIRGTPGANFAADLDSLKAQVAFQALQTMREASKTGGALGSITERELDRLEASLGALSEKQGTAQFQRNLANIASEIMRMQTNIERAYREKYGERGEPSQFNARRGDQPALPFTVGSGRLPPGWTVRVKGQ